MYKFFQKFKYLHINYISIFVLQPVPSMYGTLGSTWQHFLEIESKQLHSHPHPGVFASTHYLKLFSGHIHFLKFNNKKLFFFSAWVCFLKLIFATS